VPDKNTLLDSFEMMAGDDFVEPLYRKRLEEHYEKQEKQRMDTINHMRQDEQRRLAKHRRSGDSLSPTVRRSSVTNSRSRHERTLSSQSGQPTSSPSQGPFRPGPTVAHKQLHAPPSSKSQSSSTSPDSDITSKTKPTYESKEEKKRWQRVYDALVLDYIREGPMMRLGEAAAEQLKQRWRQEFDPPESEELGGIYIREVIPFVSC
jgi:hypothetical protein